MLSHINLVLDSLDRSGNDRPYGLSVFSTMITSQRDPGHLALQ